MYRQHFSLSRLPFENVPDPAFFFDEDSRSRVLKRMNDCLQARRGLMIVTGPIGSGKTTLSQKLMSALPEHTHLIWLAEPPATSDDLLLFLLQELGGPNRSSGRVFDLRDIRDRLLQLHEDGNRCLVIMDEAHKISDDALEGLRLLNNLEQFGDKLIQILLLGQEEFVARFSQPELTAFKQRIAWLEQIGKLTLSQTRDYILYRLRVAGSHTQIFSDAAIEAIAVASAGIPRVINSLCDKSLSVCCDQGLQTVELDIVRHAADDLGLGRDIFFYLLRSRAHSQGESNESEPTICPPLSNTTRHSPESESKIAKGFGQALPAPSARPTISPHASAVNTPGGRGDQDTEPSLAGPLALLLFSILLFLASLWFYFEYVAAEPFGL